MIVNAEDYTDTVILIKALRSVATLHGSALVYMNGEYIGTFVIERR